MPRLGIVALVVGEHGADVERVRMGDVRRLHRGQRERGVDVVAALGRVAAKDPEAHQRDLELDREDRVRAAAERERDGGAQVVELGLERAGSTPACSGPCSPCSPALAISEEVVAMPRRGRRELARA